MSPVVSPPVMSELAASPLVARALRDNQLTSLVELRARGVVPNDTNLGRSLEGVIAQADLLALGAAADLARRAECGNQVRIFVPRAPSNEPSLVVIDQTESARGTILCRRIAALRLVSPIGTRIALDFAALGIEIAQVALSFGATDLIGPIATRRGLPMVDTGKAAFKRHELTGRLARAGFSSVFIAVEGSGPAPNDWPPAGALG